MYLYGVLCNMFFRKSNERTRVFAFVRYLKRVISTSSLYPRLSQHLHHQLKPCIWIFQQDTLTLLRQSSFYLVEPRITCYLKHVYFPKGLILTMTLDNHDFLTRNFSVWSIDCGIIL